jgi:hypothetical protein
MEGIPGVAHVWYSRNEKCEQRRSGGGDPDRRLRITYFLIRAKGFPTAQR